MEFEEKFTHNICSYGDEALNGLSHNYSIAMATLNKHDTVIA